LEGEGAARDTAERLITYPEIKESVLKFRKKNKETYLRKSCR